MNDELPPVPGDDLGEVDLNLAYFWERLDNMADAFLRLLPALVIGILVFILFLVIAGLVRRFVISATARSRKANVGMVLGRLAQWGLVLLGLLVAMAIVMPSVTPANVIGALGIGGVAIGFAFKDILQNFLAGILLLLREPFKVGDQIVYREFEGTVTAIETRATFIRTYDGRQVIIPNGEIYTNAVTVNTAERIRRTEYDIGVGYGDDPALALEEILRAVKASTGVLAEPAPEVLVTELAESTVNIRARWWTKSTRVDVLKVQSDVLRNVKLALTSAGIDLPFPTQVMLWHDQTEETDGDRTRQREGWPAGKAPPKPRKMADVHETRGRGTEGGP